MFLQIHYKSRVHTSKLAKINKQTNKNLVQIITYKVQIFPCDTVDDFDSGEILNLDFPASYFLARESFASEFKWSII